MLITSVCVPVNLKFRFIQTVRLKINFRLKYFSIKAASNITDGKNIAGTKNEYYAKNEKKKRHT